MVYTKFTSVALVSVLALGLAGCSSSSNSTSTPAPTTPETPAPTPPSTGTASLAAAVTAASEVRANAEEYDALAADARATIDSVIATGAMAEATDLPTTASYSGSFLGATEDRTAAVRGAMIMEVDFDGGTLTGAMTNLISDDYEDGMLNEPVSGALGIDGTVSAADVAATISGTAATDGTGVNVSGTMGGQFRGEGASDGAGGLNATITGDGPAQTFNGGWHVRRVMGGED